MAIAFRSVSAAASATSGDITITKPAGVVDDDILVVHISALDNVVLSFPAGWTVIHEVNRGALHRGTIAWKRASSEPANYLITHTAGNDIIGVIAAYSGVLTSGSPINASSFNPETSPTDPQGDSITPSVADCMILFYIAYDNDRTTSGYTGTNPTFVERFDELFGVVISIAGADGLKNDTTATGNRTATPSGGANSLSFMVALEPAPEGLLGAMMMG